MVIFRILYKSAHLLRLFSSNQINVPRAALRDPSEQEEFHAAQLLVFGVHVKAYVCLWISTLPPPLYIIVI
jgi:hypothetical protein